MAMAILSKLLPGIPEDIKDSKVKKTLQGFRDFLDEMIKKIEKGRPKALFIDENNNIGIGTTSPTYKLEVAGSDVTKIAIDTRSGNAQATFIGLANRSATDRAITMLQGHWDVTTVGRIHIMSGDDIINKDDGYIRFDVAEGGVLSEAMRIEQNGNVGIGTTSPTALLDVNSDILRLRTAKTPASAGADGNAGDICWDSDYVYVCVATNTWKRSALSTW